MHLFQRYFLQIRELRMRHPSIFRDIPSTMTQMKAILTSSNGLPFTPEGLNVSVREDAKFLTEVFLINAIVDAVRSLANGYIYGINLSVDFTYTTCSF